MVALAVRYLTGIIERLLKKMFLKIESQSKFEIIIENLKESIMIVQENEEETGQSSYNSIEYINDLFITQFNTIISKFKSDDENHHDVR
jgi:hypothetical protein